MIWQNELMNVRCSERGSLLGIKIYSASSECLIECVDIPEHSPCDHSRKQPALVTTTFLLFIAILRLIDLLAKRMLTF